jgi:hypothetical protein
LKTKRQVRACRWYDPFPRLAFAMQMLYLSPDAVREGVTRELSQELCERIGLEDASSPPLRVGHRWYDRSLELCKLFELIKHSPDGLKEFAAERILDSLERKAG